MKVIITTLPNSEEAETLAEKAVENKLAACVQILPQMTSVYFWEGKVRKENEYLLIFKTNAEKTEKLQNFIAGNHSYEIPEIAVFSADKVAENYLKWLEDYLR